jgi:hypothetical protein
MLLKLRSIGAAIVCSLVVACGGGEAPNETGDAAIPQRTALAQALQAPASGPYLNTFFTWAAATYPEYFSGAADDGTIQVEGYGTFTYRHFESGNYVAVLDGSIYVYGPMSNFTILPIAPMNNFTCRVYPGTAGCASLTVTEVLNSSFDASGAHKDHTTYLFAGARYAFTLDAAAFDPFLGLYDPSGNLVASDEDGGPGTNSVILYTATKTGLHTLRASSSGSGFGPYTLRAFFTGAMAPGYIQWPNSVSGIYVTDSTRGDNFSIESTSRCLYSWNRHETMTDFCLSPDSSSGTFAGHPVKVMMVHLNAGGCAAALADPSGFQIDIDMSGIVPKVSTTNAQWEDAGCT